MYEAVQIAKGESYMKEQAIKKLRDEMAKEAKTAYIGEIGEYLCDYIKMHPRAAESILAPGKSISGAAEALRKAASQKPRKGQMVMIGPDEGFRIIREYFGIDVTSERPRLVSIGRSLDDFLED